MNKFLKLQSAFLKAGLINVEIPSDHVIYASSLEVAAEYGIKYIISGGNVVGESVMPRLWSYPAYDLKHIKSVYKWATGEEIESGKGKYKVPLCGIWKYNYYRHIRRIKTVYLLDYL